MRCLPSSLLGRFLVSAIAAGAALADEPFAAQRIVVLKSMEGMPADIAPLFRKHLQAFELGAVQPGSDWPGDRALKRRNDWHQVAADIEAERQTRPERLRALGAFPRDKSKAQRLYRSSGGHSGGELPWAIDECYRRLVEAFQSGDAPEVAARAGHLAHFVADGVNPFRSSANDDGAATGNLRIASARGVHPTSGGHSVRQRFGAGLVARNATAYADAIAVSPADYQPIWEPVAEAFEMIGGALAVLDEVATADREILNRLEIVDRRSFGAREEAYYAAMHQRCGSICIARLRAGAILAANLVGGAWQAAGQPSLETILARGDNGSAAGKTARATTGQAYVGSRHSNVFHSPDCRFAKQISQDNIVTFRSALEARRHSRRACKSCRPK